jgi:hypothetical protein
MSGPNKIIWKNPGGYPHISTSVNMNIEFPISYVTDNHTLGKSRQFNYIILSIN